MAFDLASVLKNDVSNMNTGLEQIEYIPIDKIDPDPSNFYSLDGLEDLAASIETVGLQQPLRVRSGAAGHVTVVSGHRRRAAVMLIVDGGSEQFKAGVPCIRETDAGSPALQELKLIYANSGTRVLTSAELSKQAERVEALLYQLKEEGFDFPGRMRDHVAQACNVSTTKLARLKVIREKLGHQFKTQYEEGKLSEQAAYALARLPKEVQTELSDAVPKKIIDGYAAERLLSAYKDGIGPVPECPKGGQCSNCGGHLRRIVTTNGWEHQCTMSECCLKCSARGSCEGVCVYAAMLNEKDKEKEQKRKEKAERDRAKGQEELRRQSIENAGRLLTAIRAAGMLHDCEKLDWGVWVSDQLDTVGGVRKLAEGKLKTDAYLYRALCDFTSVNGSSAVRIAKQLGCTTDYLFGLTDELTPADPVPAWHTGDPEESGEYVGIYGRSAQREVVYYDAEEKVWHFWKGDSETVDVYGWIPIPPRVQEAEIEKV